MTAPRVAPWGLDRLISPQHRLVALTGAGGKTALMQWLADHCRGTRRRVVVTTTTKIFPLPGVTTILQEEGPDFAGRLRKALEGVPFICIARGRDAVSGKLLGLDASVVATLHASGLADIMIVEADGAARKPLKAPNRHEPVIPAGTDLCIGVMGLDAVHRPLSEENVHRHDIFSRLTTLAPGEKVTPAHMARLARDPNGLFKGAPPDCDLRVFLNKTDIPGGPELAEEFNSLLIEGEEPAALHWFAGSVRERQVVRLDGCIRLKQKRLRRVAF